MVRWYMVRCKWYRKRFLVWYAYTSYSTDTYRTKGIELIRKQDFRVLATMSSTTTSGLERGLYDLSVMYREIPITATHRQESRDNPEGRVQEESSWVEHRQEFYNG